MNTNGLAKLYDCLTPQERLPLILAAAARGDEIEHDRLARSAPREGFWVPDYHGLVEGLLLAGFFHLLALLDLAVLFRDAGEMMEQESGPKGDKVRLRRYTGLTRLFGYLITVKVDGWALCCAEWNVDSEQPLRTLPGYETARNTAEEARDFAFTPDEAADWMRRTFKAPAGGSPAAFQLVTAADEAASLRAIVNQSVRSWA